MNTFWHRIMPRRGDRHRLVSPETLAAILRTEDEIDELLLEEAALRMELGWPALDES